MIRHVVMLLFSLFTEEGLVGEIEVDDVVIVEALQVFAGKADRLTFQFRPRSIVVFSAMHQRHQVFRLDHSVAFHRPAVGKEIELDARCTFALLNYIQINLAGTLAEAVEESELIVAEDELRHPSALAVLIYLALKQAVEEAITRLIAHLERQFDRFSRHLGNHLSQLGAVLASGDVQLGELHLHNGVTCSQLLRSEIESVVAHTLWDDVVDNHLLCMLDELQHNF